MLFIQIPKQDTIDFLLAAAPEPVEDDKSAEESAKVLRKTGTVIYCVDVSGSMASTTQLPSLQCKCKQYLTANLFNITAYVMSTCL